MTLAKQVRVARRFQRAVRVDADLAKPKALEGFVCPQSFSDMLTTMARHVSEDAQGAFTWTGPYGSGKSSLVVALSSVLGGNAALREMGRRALGDRAVTALWNALAPHKRGWRILPVVGRREHPAQVVGEAVQSSGFLRGQLPMVWSESQVLSSLLAVAAQYPRAGGGLVVFIDEMGKFLEGAARGETDVYFFQQLAEAASRSDRRLIVVGILHQAFEGYASRLSHEARDEWSKVQGRFIDLAISTSEDEQVDLLARAIEGGRKSEDFGYLARQTARRRIRQTSPEFARTLENCWPLHPIAACLLGPLSRRRFSQNQRSVFGFLNSADPHGFRDFLHQATEHDLYTVDRLWDYLQLNLEPAIMASPDGNRWTLAVDALESCEARGGGELDLRLLKTIALVDMVKERSGLMASLELLQLALWPHASGKILDALDRLQAQALVIHRKFRDSFSIFEGSDFDLEQAMQLALGAGAEIDFDWLNELVGLRPVVAKRHYHETGALRWFEFALASLSDFSEGLMRHSPATGAIGTIFLVISTQHEPLNFANEMARKYTRQATEGCVILGVPQISLDIAALVRELLAVESVRENAPELQGDKVARREVHARIWDLQSCIEAEVGRALEEALWFCSGLEGRKLPVAGLSELASDLADIKFKSAPILHSELLNRTKPSSSAVAARNSLLRKMVHNEGMERLGIQGFPAEGGLFATLLEATALYCKSPRGWRFLSPCDHKSDPRRLASAWEVATGIISGARDRLVSMNEIYDVWRAPPCGIKEGLLPVMATAFLLTQRQHLAIYRQTVFQSSMSDLDVDYLIGDPKDIQVRWMELSDAARCLLRKLANIVGGG